MSGLAPLTTAQAIPVSDARFDDGGAYRIEIPSVEGPAAMAAVLEAGAQRGVRVNRISQGSGAMLQTRAELREMAALGRDGGTEVCLFVGPRGVYGTGLLAHLPAGESIAWGIQGDAQLAAAVADVERAVGEGIRSFLIADIGLMARLRALQVRGDLPDTVTWKISAAIPASNSDTLRILADLGATTINVPSDVSAWQLHELRRAVPHPLDLYLEAPNGMGGTIRFPEAAQLLAVGAPMYLKLGLANAQGVYPAGRHLEKVVIDQAVEKVRRAEIAIEQLPAEFVQSPNAGSGPGIPEA